MTARRQHGALDPAAVAAAQTIADLAGLLRQLRRRHARRRHGAELTCRELAARTGWSKAAIAEYLTGKRLPPTDRFDALAGLLGASPAEQAALATARDRIDEQRRRRHRAAATRPVPRQLPAPVRHFTGRVAEIQALTGLLAQAKDPSGGAVVIAVITGVAGIGKTALAVCWAHRVREEFPDGQLYADLHGFGHDRPATTPAEAVRGFLDALAVPARQRPAGLDAQAALYRSVLAGRRMLVLLDNARDTNQVRPLLPGQPGGLVLVTSREPLTGLVAAEGALPLRLDLLTPGQCWRLLVRRLGRERVAAEHLAAGDMVARSGRLPAALAVLAARAATHPDLPLAAIAGADLGAPRSRLVLSRQV